MKERIEGKINEIVKHIIKKPVGEITLDDYTILTNERHEIQTKEAQTANGKRMAELMASTFPGFGST